MPDSYSPLGTQKRGTKKSLKTFVDTFFARSKASIQRKGAQQLGLRLSSRKP